MEQNDRLFIRFSSEEKARLKKAVDDYKKLSPGSPLTVSSVARMAVLARLEELENEIKQAKPRKK